MWHFYVWGHFEFDLLIKPNGASAYMFSITAQFRVCFVFLCFVLCFKLLIKRYFSKFTYICKECFIHIWWFKPPAANANLSNIFRFWTNILLLTFVCLKIISRPQNAFHNMTKTYQAWLLTIEKLKIDNERLKM